MTKNKKEQLKELEIIAKPYAIKECPHCNGTGVYKYIEEEKRYIHCPCVLENIKSIVEGTTGQRYDNIPAEDV